MFYAKSKSENYTLNDFLRVYCLEYGRFNKLLSFCITGLSLIKPRAHQTFHWKWPNFIQDKILHALHLYWGNGQNVLCTVEQLYNRPQSSLCPFPNYLSAYLTNLYLSAYLTNRYVTIAVVLTASAGFACLVGNEGVSMFLSRT